jgi:HTH-type transcriptional regulator, sugar sensing transcriptional regulator
MQIELLYKLGFSDKSAKVYMALLQLGPSSVRNVAEKADLNRGTENPEKLHELIRRKNTELAQVDRELEKIVPELQAIHDKGGERPVAKYFDSSDLKDILEDVLLTCEQSEEQAYRIYSTEGIREFLYKDFPTFSDVRIAKSISVKVIAIGDGGELRGLDERKWLSGKQSTQGIQNKVVSVPTYIILYPGKSAYISLNAKQEVVGVVIENQGVSGTQQRIFDSLWDVI